jgi:hypothetical protein
MECQRRDSGLRGSRISHEALTEQSTRFLTELRKGVGGGGHFDDITTAAWASTRLVLDGVSFDRIAQGFS